MAFTEQEQKTIWAFTASSLLLGNVNFDDSTLTDSVPCSIKNEDALKNIAKLLGLDYAKFSKSLRFKLRTIGVSTIESTINKEECLIYRDGLAKDLFNRLFNWLVKRLNFTVMPENFTKPGANIPELMKTYYHIGLLDIFGFEIFKVNSLEQFCINFANERLQQLYVYYVFKAEEKEFILEGLKDYLHELNFKDNQSLLDMLEGNKPPGIFQLIDESASVNTTDSALAGKIVGQFKKPEYPLTTAKVARDTFIVKHSAKDVEYNVNGFRAKNKDELSKFIEETLSGSSIPDVKNVWRNLCNGEVESADSKKATNPKDKFLGYKFRMQMKDLVDELNSCACHFVRCIKPNEKKEAGLFVSAMVLQQIQYMGVLDTIKVRKQSYPTRRIYKSFYERYQELDPVNSKVYFEEHERKGTDFKALTTGICQRSVPHHGTSTVLFGETRIFLRIEAVKDLEKLRYDIIRKKNLVASRFQAAWKGYRQCKKYRAMKKGVAEVQKLFRVGKEFQKYVKAKKSARKLQKWWRYVLWRRYMQKTRKCTIEIQTWWKAVYYRQKYLRKVEAIKKINRVWRGALARRKVRRLRHVKEIIQTILNKCNREIMKGFQEKAALVIQRYTRGYLCRCRYEEKVIQIRKTKEDFIYNKNIKIIQRNIRRFIVRATFARLNKAAGFIQGYVKMRWLSALFQAVRIATVRIQKVARAWLWRRNIIRERMEEFLNTEVPAFEAVRKVEQNNFFGTMSPTKVSKPNTFDDKRRESTLTVNGQNLVLVNDIDELEGTTSSLNTNRDIDPYTSSKIHLSARVLDIEPLADLTYLYDSLWSQQTLQLQKECMRTDTEIQILEVGQAHTLSVSNANKVYSYGWNDCYQLGRATSTPDVISSYAQIPQLGDHFRPKSVAVGDDHNLMTDYEGNLYVWGDNSKGQLGIGNCCQTTGITVLALTKNDSIKEVKAKGHNSLAVTEKGKVFYWPVELPSGEILPKPVEMILPPKIEIVTASCGYNFAVVVSKNGLVFSFGSDNKAGQLGHGDTTPREMPTLIEAMKHEGEKVSAVSCGYKHVICKTSLGKVYTWGWGTKGQLGHGTYENELVPKLVPIYYNNSWCKALTVQAGFKHSMVLLENKRVVWWGSNNTIQDECLPVEVNLYQKIPSMNNDFTPVRILCAWSKTMNLTYVTMADTRTLGVNPTIKSKVLGTLTAKIEESHAFNDINPPHVPSIAKYFPSKVMTAVVPKEKKLIRSPSKIIHSPTLNGPRGFSPEGLKAPYLTESLAKSRQSICSRILVNGEESIMQGLRTGQPSPRPSFTQDHQDLSELLKPSKPKTPIARTPNKLTPPKNRISNETKNSESFSGYNQRSTKDLRKGYNGKASNSKLGASMGEDDIYEKLAEIKRKMVTIAKTPKSLWTKAEKEFWKYATDPQMFSLLKDI